MDVGQPPLASLMDGTVSQYYRGQMTLIIPPELHHNLLVQECSYRAVCALSKDGEYISGSQPEMAFYVEMEALEESFDLLQQNLSVSLSFFNTLRLSAARLYFQCTYFLRETENEQRKKGILRAYSTAVSLITITISHETAYEELPYAPATTARIIFVAALVIFRVLHSSYALAGPHELDRDAGHVLYRAAGFAIRQLSVQGDEKDFPIRAADMLNELWRVGENDSDLRGQVPNLRARSRMGSSLVFDCLLIWRAYQNQPHERSVPHGLEPQAGSAVDLPRTPPIQRSILPGVMQAFDPSMSDSFGDWDQSPHWDLPQDTGQYSIENWGLYDLT